MCIRDRYITDSVFIIVPNLIRDCIIGISLLQESKCIINLKDNHITFNNNTNGKIPICSEILTVEIAEEEEKIETTIREKLEETTGISAQTKKELEDILFNNYQVFREYPGRIARYEHRFVVTDTTPYCMKGWPVP